jgi:hypothetical protein
VGPKANLDALAKINIPARAVNCIPVFQSISNNFTELNTPLNFNAENMQVFLKLGYMKKKGDSKYTPILPLPDMVSLNPHMMEKKPSPPFPVNMSTCNDIPPIRNVPFIVAQPTPCR